MGAQCTQHQCCCRVANCTQHQRGCPPQRFTFYFSTSAQQLRNMLGAFENLAPGLCYGGVHKAVLQLYLG